MPVKLECTFKSLEDLLKEGLWFRMLGVEVAVGVATGTPGLGGVCSHTSVCMGLWARVGAEILPACQAPKWCRCCWLLNHTFRSGHELSNSKLSEWDLRLPDGTWRPTSHYIPWWNWPTLAQDAWASADFTTGCCWWVLIEWFFPSFFHAGLLVAEYLCPYIMHSTNWFLKHIILTKCEHS